MCDRQGVHRSRCISHQGRYNSVSMWLSCTSAAHVHAFVDSEKSISQSSLALCAPIRVSQRWPSFNGRFVLFAITTYNAKKAVRLAQSTPRIFLLPDFTISVHYRTRADILYGELLHAESAITRPLKHSLCVRTRSMLGADV